MSDAYDLLSGSLRERGIDVPAAERALASLVVETPSWGYGDSGTRFGVFRQAGRPRDVRERIDDAAEVHRLTGTAGAVALHFPWDAAHDYDELRAYIEGAGLRGGAVNPNLFQDPDYRLGSIAHPDPRVREKAVRHLLECLEIATALGASAQSLWLADGTNYPGQDDLRERRRRLMESLARVYEALPPEQELLVEYKLFEPAFYATDLADWGSALLVCERLGDRASVLVDLGHHAQAGALDVRAQLVVVIGGVPREVEGHGAGRAGEPVHLGRVLDALPQRPGQQVVGVAHVGRASRGWTVAGVRRPLTSRKRR